MQKIRDWVQDALGNAIPGASVSVYKAGTPTLAALYSDNGITSLANPLTSRADGGYTCYAANGLYDLVISKSPYTFDPTETSATRLFDPQDVVINVKDYPYWAKGDGVTDDTAAIAAAFNALNAAGSPANKRLLFPPGQYVVTSALPAITVSNWMIDAYGARILLNGTGSFTGMQFGYNNPTTNRLTGVSVKGLTVVKNGTGVCTGIKVVGWSTFSSMDDVTVFMGYNGANGDKALYVLGENESGFRNLSLQGDKPLVLGNPSGTSGDGLDQVNFHNLSLYSGSNLSPLITVENGASWGTLSFTGTQIWVGGNAGFSYNDTGATSNSGNLLFENIRREDNTSVVGTRASGYTIDIQFPAALSAQLVSVRNSQFTYGTAVNGTVMNGIRLHSQFIHLLVDSYYDGGSTGQTFLEATGQGSTVDNITLTNVNAGSATISLTNTKGYRPILVTGLSGTSTAANNLRGTATFASAATVAVTFATAEPDANYFVSLSGNANQTFWVTNKLTTGFTLNSSIGTSTASVDWHLIR